MEVGRLVQDLKRPEAYPHPADDLELIQTHISVVALAGRYAYKVRKPVDLGFLDFTTRDKRDRDCQEEVRLNRRLAPDVYLGVVPLTEVAGRIVVGGDGPPVEHAVKMVRLPAEATLLQHLLRDALTPDILTSLGKKIADFHHNAASGEKISRYGRWDVIAGNARENLEQSRSHVGTALSNTVARRLSRALERRLTELRELTEARADADRPCDTHGDLHLDHVYLFPEKEPPGDLVVIDCIEFNERFRYADPVADMAFLVMDLRVHGRHDLAEAFARAYFERSRDAEGRVLLDFYVAYRAAVRGKVDGLLAADDELPTEEKRAAIERAKAHWLLALAELEDPSDRPCLVLVGGLPGTGKSTLCESLVETAGFDTIIASDRTRKRLAGLAPEESGGAAFGEGIYTSEWTDRTYEACLDAACEALFEGARVLVDASFGQERHREAFLRAAQRFGVKALFIELRAEPEAVRQRIATREGGVSDADWAVHQKAAQAWEPPASEMTQRRRRTVRCDASPSVMLAETSRHLRDEGLV